MSAPQSVADSVLGLTQAELLLFRHQQQIQIAAQRSHASGTAQDRGRGTSRQSQPSSRAASAASSQGVPGRIMLDPHSLQDLCNHMDNVMRGLQGRIERLENATSQSVHSSSNRAATTAQEADAQIRRMKAIITEIGRCEDEFEKLKHIREKIRLLRIRVDNMSDRLDRSHSSGHGSGTRPRR